MNVDFRLSVGLFTHHKFIMLQRRLGAAGGLSFINLLAWTAQHRPDGVLGHVKTDYIAIDANYPGAGDEFVSTLVEVGLLDSTDKGYVIHDWAEHNPWASKAPDRIEKARKAAEARWGKSTELDAPSTDEHCETTVGECNNDATSMLPASVSNATEHDPAMPPILVSLVSLDNAENGEKEKDSPQTPQGDFPSVEPPARKHRGRRAEVPDYDPDGFAQFRSVYPRNDDWPDAAAAWDSVRPTKSEQATISTMCSRFGGRKLKGAEALKVKMPAPWLRAQRWKNDHPFPGLDGEFGSGERSAGPTGLVRRGVASGVSAAERAQEILDELTDDSDAWFSSLINTDRAQEILAEMGG